MNSCCLNYYEIPEKISKPKILTSELSACGNTCQCGYIQFESLVPDLPKLSNNYTKDEDYIILDARLRRQIIEISRLFDRETDAKEGFYSKAHSKVIKLYGNGTKYLEIPEFVEGTLELYTEDGYLINPSTYIHKDGFLIISPCLTHSSNCGCSLSCGHYNTKLNTIAWNCIVQAKAKFGRECADKSVQMAIRDFIIEYNTYSDPKEVIYNGNPQLISRGFKVPYSWSTLVRKTLEDKKLNHYFGFA